MAKSETSESGGTARLDSNPIRDTVGTERTPIMAETIQRNFQLRLPTLTLLEQLEEKLHVSQTAVVHLAILEMAERGLPDRENQHPEKMRKKSDHPACPPNPQLIYSLNVEVNDSHTGPRPEP